MKFAKHAWMWHGVGGLLTALLLASCGGGGGSSSGTSQTAQISTSQAARFLTQATFGPRQTDIDQLVASSYDSWITNQLNLPATLQLPQIPASGTPTALRNARMEAWWNTAINGQDQLRQRVAFALSEIFVVSDRSDSLSEEVRAIAYYHDLLAKDAFGTFRTLLEDVTLSPAMGLYLNMQGNQKPDPANNIHADENYAREVMQLFTVGLVQLNADGTVKTSGGNPIPTYGQPDVSGLARVLTGWSWNSADFFNGPANNIAQMIPFTSFHDTDGKTIVGGIAIAGGDARAELKTALDTLANHPNVGPFICRQLIQRLVTSNPSPAYVGRMAQIFADNGKGVRGDLGAVVRAILLDMEARSDSNIGGTAYGKLREPLLMATHLWRAFNAGAANGKYQEWNPEDSLGQAPFSAPSVFNFFNPRFSPTGPIQQAGLVAPEFQRINAASVAQISNFLAGHIFNHDQGNTGAQTGDILLNLDTLRVLASGGDSGPLVDKLNLLLMSGQMSANMRQLLVTRLNGMDASDRGTARILEAIFLTMGSPAYQVQK